MLPQPPRSKRTDPLVPYTTRFRSARVDAGKVEPLVMIEQIGRILRSDLQIVGDFEREPVGHRDAFPLDIADDDLGQRFHIGRDERDTRSEEHTSELQSLMRISYAVFCLKKKNHNIKRNKYIT